MKNLLLVAAVFCLFSFTLQNKSLKKRSIDGKIKLLVPKSFDYLNEDEEQPTQQTTLSQFMSRSEPIAIFANDDQSITLMIQETIDPSSQSKSKKQLEVEKNMSTARDLETERGFKKASFQTMFDNVRFLQDEVKKINGRDFIVFEMEGKLSGENGKGEKTVSYRYNYILYGYSGNKSYSINFSAPLDQKQNWQATVEQIMQSVEL